MASTVICFGLYPKSIPNSPNVSVSSSIPLNPSAVSQISAISSSPKSKSSHLLKLNHCSGASVEGIPSELIEDSKFVPINADDASYGPPVIYCTKSMITQSLWKAMHTKQPNLEDVKIAKSLPRICFLSSSVVKRR